MVWTTRFLAEKVVIDFWNHCLLLCSLWQVTLLLLWHVPPVQPGSHQRSHLHAGEAQGEGSLWDSESWSRVGEVNQQTGPMQLRTPQPLPGPRNVRSARLAHSWLLFLFSPSVMSDSLQPMDYSIPGFPVLHHLQEHAQTHVHWVSDAIQPSHPLSSPSPPAFNHSQHQGSSKESALCIRWPKYWSFIITPSNEYSGLISFRIDWFDLCAVKGTLKSLFQHHSSKHQFSLLYGPTVTSILTTGKNIPFTIQTFVGKVTFMLFNMLSRFIIAFLPRSKCLLISWLQSLFAVILEPKIIMSVAVSIVSPSICNEGMGPDAIIFIFWMLSFEPAFSLSSFTLIKRFFSSSSLSATTVLSFANLRLLMFLLAILIPSSASSSLAFLLMYSAYKLNKQGDNNSLDVLLSHFVTSPLFHVWF